MCDIQLNVQHVFQVFGEFALDYTFIGEKKTSRRFDRSIQDTDWSGEYRQASVLHPFIMQSSERTQLETVEVAIKSTSTSEFLQPESDWWVEQAAKSYCYRVTSTVVNMFKLKNKLDDHWNDVGVKSYWSFIRLSTYKYQVPSTKQVSKTRYSQEFSRSAQLSGFTGDTNETHKNVQPSLFKATRYAWSRQ